MPDFYELPDDPRMPVRHHHSVCISKAQPSWVMIDYGSAAAALAIPQDDRTVDAPGILRAMTAEEKATRDAVRAEAAAAALDASKRNALEFRRDHPAHDALAAMAAAAAQVQDVNAREAFACLYDALKLGGADEAPHPIRG